MCLDKVDAIAKEEHFQKIGYKMFKIKEGAYCSFFQGAGIYEIGKLYFDENSFFNSGFGGTPKYKTGYHVLERFPWTDTYPLFKVWQVCKITIPVLYSDVVAVGREYTWKKVIVARIMYLLTKKEFDYLSEEYAPIKFGKFFNTVKVDPVEREELELVQR